MPCLIIHNSQGMEITPNNQMNKGNVSFQNGRNPGIYNNVD